MGGRNKRIYLNNHREANQNHTTSLTSRYVDTSLDQWRAPFRRSPICQLVQMHRLEFMATILALLLQPRKPCSSLERWKRGLWKGSKEETGNSPQEGGKRWLTQALRMPLRGVCFRYRKFKHRSCACASSRSSRRRKTEPPRHPSRRYSSHK